MEQINQPSQRSQNLDNLRKWIVFYGDIAIRGVISFIIMISLLAIIRVFFNISIVVSLIIAFIVSIAIAPLFSKIKVADKVVDKYIMFLNKLFKL